MAKHSFETPRLTSSRVQKCFRSKEGHSVGSIPKGEYRTHEPCHDNDCDWETALHWALYAKNSLNNVHGFNSYQLVFGRNPNIPGVLIDQLPALEGTTSSQTVGKHLAALHAARTAFTQSECSERIRRALRKRIRTNNGERYEHGDKVFYKRPDSTEWKGPGSVIGQDGSVVFVRHGGTYVRVHTCRLTKVKEKPDENEQGNHTDESMES